MNHPLIRMIDTMMGCDPDKAGCETLPRATLSSNAAGEVPGIGPEWVCDSYAKPDHDYGTCSTCYSNYETNYLPSLKGATK